jgi:hypothetical protein
MSGRYWYGCGSGETGLEKSALLIKYSARENAVEIVGESDCLRMRPFRVIAV